MQATSRPAPREPLTEQERLLVQIAATGDAKRTELLNPEIQRQRQLEAKAEFDHFFNVAKTGDRE
jgi:hypothetical protein